MEQDSRSGRFPTSLDRGAAFPTAAGTGSTKGPTPPSASPRFDIFLLGISDQSPRSWRRLELAVELFRKGPGEPVRSCLGTGRPLFRGLEKGEAVRLVEALQEASARVEVRPLRPGQEPPPEPEPAAEPTSPEQRGWDERAMGFRAENPLPSAAVAPFADLLHPDEIAFCGLLTREGPILLTSRRLLWRERGAGVSTPYELVAKAAGGREHGLLSSRNRLRLTFLGPVPSAAGPVRSSEWELVTTSMKLLPELGRWVEQRCFTCRGCGSGELQYRLEGSDLHGRCMHCAADHRVDCARATMTPVLPAG